MSLRFPVEVSWALDADISADPSTWAWTPITAYVLLADGPVRIGRGRKDGQSFAGPSQCTLLLNNTGGRFSPRNPDGPYFGRFGRNTPIRVRVDPGTGFVTRFVGFVSEWPPQWEGPGIAQRVPVTANGRLRRLGQGNTPAHSAIHMQVARESSLLAYWSLEDGSGSTLAASAVAGVGPMVPTSNVSFGSVTAPAGSGSLPDLSAGARLTTRGAALPKSGTGQWRVDFLLKVEDVAGVDHFPVIWRVVDGTAIAASGGAIQEYRLRVNTAGTVTVEGFDAAGTQVLTGADQVIATIDVFTGKWFHITVDAGVTINLHVRNVDTGAVESSSSGLLAGQVGSVSSIIINPGSATASAGLKSVGHLCVFDDVDDADAGIEAAAIAGYVGERAAVRFARLCTAFDIAADVADGYSVKMGAQRIATPLNLLRDCESADAGLIVERRTSELGFDPHGSLENQPVAFTLPYGLGRISPPLRPIDDDQRIRNDVTVTRIGGSSGQFVQKDGPLGTDPKTGVGQYDHSVSLNLHVDDQAVQLASWMVGLGTVDELRFPLVNPNLNGPSAQLVASWAACDVGSRVQITNPPRDVGPDAIDLLLEGYTEAFDGMSWRADAYCSPYRPYLVGVYAEDNMALLTAETTTSTAWRIASNPGFTVNSDDLPVALRVGGEVVSVTGVVNVAVGVNVGTAAHADNALVTPTLPAHIEGDLLIVFAACRNSGVGSVDLPSGWTNLYNTNNMRVFGKYATSAAEPNPAVTFSGTAAGDTTSAVPFLLRGCQLQVLNSKEQTNGSAQNIAYPHYVQEGDDVQILQFCWKQDDYTSVAPGDGVEFAEASTTVGNDQSLYVVRAGTSGDPTPGFAAGAHVVTGGAAAISRVIWLTIPRRVVDLTVVRSVNGVIASHAQLADVQVDKPLIWAL